jgi:lysyl-tRNA synthetase class 2
VVAVTTHGDAVVNDEGRLRTIPGLAPGQVEVGDLVMSTPAGVERVFHSPRGEWPPSLGSPGEDLARFTAERWDRLRRRAAIVRGTRQWFENRGFLEVETPLVVRSPGTEVHLDPVGVKLRETTGQATSERWLITSPEYAMKRLLAAGAPPIWQMCKVFRDGERGGNHRPEFTMLEWYRPWVEGYAVLMDDCESLLTTLAGDHLDWRGKRYELGRPWPRLRFFDLLRERAGLLNPESLTPDHWFAALVDKVEPTLGVERPEFVIEWPIELASLSRPHPENPRVAERFELYLGRLELANAFAELTDSQEQRRRCELDNAEREASGKPVLPVDEDFLGALEAGMPPSAGIAMGFDRLVMVLTDAATIDDVLAF